MQICSVYCKKRAEHKCARDFVANSIAWMRLLSLAPVSGPHWAERNPAQCGWNLVIVAGLTDLKRDTMQWTAWEMVSPLKSSTKLWMSSVDCISSYNIPAHHVTYRTVFNDANNWSDVRGSAIVESVRLDGLDTVGNSINVLHCMYNITM